MNTKINTILCTSAIIQIFAYNFMDVQLGNQIWLPAFFVIENNFTLYNPSNIDNHVHVVFLIKLSYVMVSTLKQMENLNQTCTRLWLRIQKLKSLADLLILLQVEISVKLAAICYLFTNHLRSSQCSITNFVVLRHPFDKNVAKLPSLLIAYL